MRLLSLKFNPLLCTFYRNFVSRYDLDPDVNFYHQNLDCEYYTKGSFKYKMFENHDRVNFNNDYENPALLHLNNPRIFHKLDKISNFLGRYCDEILCCWFIWDLAKWCKWFTSYNLILFLKTESVGPSEVSVFTLLTFRTQTSLWLGFYWQLCWVAICWNQ